MVLALIANIFTTFDIPPKVLAPGVMHLQENFSFHLKVNKKK